MTVPRAAPHHWASADRPLDADAYIVPVSELLLTGSYEIDHTGMMYAGETA